MDGNVIPAFSRSSFPILFGSGMFWMHVLPISNFQCSRVCCVLCAASCRGSSFDTAILHQPGTDIRPTVVHEQGSDPLRDSVTWIL